MLAVITTVPLTLEAERTTHVDKNDIIIPILQMDHQHIQQDEEICKVIQETCGILQSFNHKIILPP